MKIEFLFPELCNLFGDSANISYLQKTLPDAEIIRTALADTPLFLREKVGLVYLGAMTEHTQERVIQRLLPFADDIRREIERGTVFLFTGNALEILGEYIENENGSRIPCLNILPLTAKRDRMHRHHSVFAGSFENEPVMGFKTQFTMCTPTSSVNPLFHVQKGVGLNPALDFEGIRVNNFFGTYLLGPILILNPPFTEYLLERMGAKNTPLAFEREARRAYMQRKADFDRLVRPGKQPKRV